MVALRSTPLQTTAFDQAQRLAGIVDERPGPKDNHPAIVWGLELCGLGRNQPDEIPWCSALCNLVAWWLRLPRSKSATARSWLAIGMPVELQEAEPAFDVVILKRGSGQQPGPEDLSAPGHVGFFGRVEYGPTGERWVWVLGGNQTDAVTLARFNADNVLGVRRLLC